MRKVTRVILFLIALDTCAIFNFAEAIEPAGSRNVNNKPHRSQQPQVINSPREEYSEDDEYASKGSEIFGQPIGRWRSTGDALEPKWRDGDSVPLGPFNTATIASHSPNNKKTESNEANKEKSFVSNRHSTLRKSHNQEKTTLITDEYDFNKNAKPERRNDYQGFRSREIRLSRRRKPPQLEVEERIHTTDKFPSESEDLQKNQDRNKMETRIPKILYDNNEYLEGVALRYRETFQNPPDEYELNDEEYQRPRPRKRRPPQNDEFDEVKTPAVPTSERSTLPVYSTFRSQKKQESTRRNNLTRTNHNRTMKTSDSDKPSENSELKSLLKMQQVEGSSLSEILQRRNLTLSDLLQGKADVINLLKSSHVEDKSGDELNAKARAIEMMKISASSSISLPSTTERVHWVPRQTVIAKNFEKQTDDPLSTFIAASTHAYQKVLPTQKEQERVHPTESMNSVKLPVSSEIPIIVTTTDSANLEEKDKVKIIYDEDEIMEFSDFSVKSSNPTTEVNDYEKKDVSKIFELNQDSGTTLSIEHILNPTKEPSTDGNESKENIDKFLEQSREKIQLENKIPHSENEEDDSNNGKIDSFELEYQNDGPHDIPDYKEIDKVSKETIIDKPVSTEKATFKDPQNLEELTFKNHKTIQNYKNYEIYSEIEPDARAEIFELFNSGSSAKKLESLLKARNMSIEDLIALRQRGSSQVHLAEAAQTRDNNLKSTTKKDLEQSQDSQDGKKKPMDVRIVKSDCPPPQEVKEFTEWEQTKKEPKKEILHIKEFETLPPIWSDKFGYPHSFAPNEGSKQTKEEIISKSKQGVNPESQDQSDDFLNILTQFESSQPLSDQESSEGISHYTSSVKVPSSNLPGRKSNSVTPIENGRVQEIMNDISNTFNNIYRLNADEGDIKARDPISRIRPSIIASVAILGVTIVVFLGIFIICRVRQKKKYTYRNTFSRAVFQSPVLTARKLSNSSSLNTIMVNVVATSTTKRPEKTASPETDDDYDVRSDIENDSLDANDSWETIPDFMK